MREFTIMYKSKIIKIKVNRIFNPVVFFKILFIILIKTPEHILRRLKNISKKNKNIEFFNKYQNEIDRVLNMVNDNLSKEVIMGQINFSKTFNFKYIRNIFKPQNSTHIENNTVLDNDHYFSKDIIELSDEEGFVNCGSYTGDTIAEFLSQTDGKFNHIFAFEPSKINYMTLCKNIENLKVSSEFIDIYQKGVYSKNGKCNFSLNTEVTGGASIKEDGKDVIDVVSLDLFFSDGEKNKITFINMDIEGAELEALKGMKEIIIKNKPKLAISVYHKPEHFWEIPFFIKSLNPSYKIYFRQHALSEAETVCYAV